MEKLRVAQTESLMSWFFDLPWELQVWDQSENVGNSAFVCVSFQILLMRYAARAYPPMTALLCRTTSCPEANSDFKDVYFWKIWLISSRQHGGIHPKRHVVGSTNTFMWCMNEKLISGPPYLKKTTHWWYYVLPNVKKNSILEKHCCLRPKRTQLDLWTASLDRFLCLCGVQAHIRLRCYLKPHRRANQWRQSCCALCHSWG